MDWELLNVVSLYAPQVRLNCQLEREEFHNKLDEVIKTKNLLSIEV